VASRQAVYQHVHNHRSESVHFRIQYAKCRHYRESRAASNTLRSSHAARFKQFGRIIYNGGRKSGTYLPYYVQEKRNGFNVF